MAPRLLAALLAACVAAHAYGVVFSPTSSDSSSGSSDDYADDPSEVRSLPGFDGALPSRHYAGYVTVDEAHGRRLFYYLVTSERGGDDDPLVLWLNGARHPRSDALQRGGPGCSSFDGFVYEHGPFTFSAAPAAESGGVSAPSGGVRLSRNPYAWSSVAHVVYLDSPAGVGLSYSDTPGDYRTNDTATARDADAFLRALVARYPQLGLANRRLYIAGESYAGIYVPNLAKTVLAGNAAGVQPALNLVGYAVGNGCTDAAYDGNALVPFAVGKSLISADLAAAAAAACDGGAGYWNASAGSACSRALDDVDAALRGLNLYDTLEDCVGRGAADALPLPTVGRAWPLRATLPPRGSPLRNWASLGVSVPCMDTSLATSWLNAPAVRDALHAAPVATTGAFEMCSNAIRYTHDAGSMLPVHSALLRAGLRALIYSGDHDMCVPHTGTEAWTRALGLPVDEDWRPWHAPPSQVAGYARTFKGGLTYATVKGAGHTVPTYKPAQALAMFARFLDAKRL